MALRRSTLRRRAEAGPGSRLDADPRRRRDTSLLGTLQELLFLKRRDRPATELDALPLPDLLTPAAVAGPPTDDLVNLLELAFLGRASAGEIDRELDAMPTGESPWVRQDFAEDLFLGELVRRCLTLQIEDPAHRPHPVFLERVLASPPGDLATVRYRQGILRELETQPALAAAFDALLAGIWHLLTLLRASRDDARLEPTRFRFDVLQAFRTVVEGMDAGFADAASGLQRLHNVAATVKAAAGYRRMAALLDHERSMATLELEAVLGADGRLRHLEIRSLRERRSNPFFRRPLRRWWDRLRVLYHSYSLRGGELTERLLMGVFQEVAPAMARVVQLVCHLEVYAATRRFADSARTRGLEVSLPGLSGKPPHRLEGLFNPLLLSLVERPVPTDLVLDGTTPVTLVTGPNSGGKTRLLQALGIAQVLGQSGLYAPCAEARLPLAAGLFASIIELDRADQAEGRLGTEMLRLRRLFETVPPGSLVLLDELCSGTNPSEAIEIIDVVLRLLRRIEPVAFVTTHFLDFAAHLRETGAVPGLGFLQAEVDPVLGATYRFIPGVASTSLAVGTARRLGITFDELERSVDGRLGEARPAPSQDVE